MKNHSYKIFLLFFFSFINSIQATTFYVATTGNDSNTGNISAPFATFSKVISVMSPGDTCIIRGGIYEEELIININGDANNYLTFKAADGENVLLKATSLINGWQVHSGNIYKTNIDMTIDSRFRAVYHNDEYMDLARWPNNVDNNRWTIDCTPVTDGNDSHFLVNNIPNIDWTGGLVYYLGAHSGTSWTRTITANTTSRIDFTTVDITDWPFTVHNPTAWRNNPGNNRGQLYLFNKLEVLDYAKEWYYDNDTNTLYLQTADGNIPANDSIEYATRKYTVQIHGDYIKLENINFFGGSVKIHNNADNNQIINCEVIHGSEGHDSLTNTSAQVNEASIEVLGDNTIIKDCTINHSSTSGIIILGWAAANCIVEGNYISNINYVGIHASPIRTTGNNSKILKNTIINAGRDGMYVAGSNSEVAYNDVSVSQIINSDSGVFYTVGNNDLKNNVIHHNWFHDATAPSYSHNPSSPAKAAGIYLDNNSKGYTVHHNVVWNVSWNGYQVNWNNTNLNFYHNTIWNAYSAMDSWVNGYSQSDNKIYNNYANTGSWFTGNGSSEFDIKDSPIFPTSPFEDVNNQNFMPASGSALVDLAPVISGFDKPFSGSSADIGAYELGGIPWTAGVNAIEDLAPSITITSQPNSIIFNDFTNPSIVTSNIPFQITINNLVPSKTYNLFNQLNNENTGIQIAGFSQTGITGVSSIVVDVYWSFFPNNPVSISLSDTFEWNISLFIPGEGLQDDEKVNNIPLDQTLTISDFQIENKKVFIFPNPTNKSFSINGIHSENATIEILSLLGKHIHYGTDVSRLSSGLYLVKITTKDSSTYIKRLLIK